MIATGPARAAEAGTGEAGELRRSETWPAAALAVGVLVLGVAPMLVLAVTQPVVTAVIP